ncbi:hypothetical protein [Halobaculum sp. EA56]|uniref:hypothetical protein n=1 Tax=Halobaculum sp. EA56 TaxID=3421648 RepID=UPI003EBCF2F7
MVGDRTADGVRIAQLLASELVGDGNYLADVTVGDADPEVEPTADGTRAYRVVEGAEGTEDDGDAAGSGADGGEGTVVAEVFVHPDRARVEFRAAPDAAARAADAEGLRVRPKAVEPPRTVVFVEDGAQVKRVLPAFEAAVRGDGEA